MQRELDRDFMKSPLTFRTAAKIYGKRYEGTVSFDLDAAKLRAGSWGYEALSALKAAERLEPLVSQDTQVLLNVIAACCANPGTRRFLVRQISGIGRREIVLCFGAMEDLLESQAFGHWGRSTVSRASSIFRRWMAEKIPTGAFNEYVARHSRYFKTRFETHFPPRRTLSEDIRDESIDADYLKYPLGAMPHGNVRELRDRMVERMTLDVNRLVDGCKEELTFWAQVRERMHLCAQHAPTEQEMLLAKKFLHREYSREEFRAIQSMSTASLASSIVHHANDPAMPRHSIGNSHTENRALIEQLMQEYGIPGERLAGLRSKHVYFLTRCASVKELLAAFYCLLVHTRYNGCVLRDLKRNWIRKEGEIYTLEGFKEKSGRDAPTIDITPENKAAYQAIELVIWHFDQMKKFGHIGRDEQQLWISWDNTSNHCLTRQISTFFAPKKVLLAQMGMPWFSEDQIRTHMLNLDQFRSKSNIEQVVQIAGHANWSTTKHYLSQLSTILQNRAINLEFQKRLDATLKFALSEHHPYFADKFDPKFVDKHLLFPIGDGTSCVNPFRPPEPEWLMNGSCDAKRCHIGQGCSQNKIVVGKDRVREIWATAKFYEKNWRRLACENEEAFVEWHGPAMIFNLELQRYLRNCSYWPRISAIVAKIEAVDEKY
jgi:hypothetical protein